MNTLEPSQGFTEDEAVAEAERCLSCKKPTCAPACPIPQDVPAYVEAISRGDFQEALAIIMRDNPFPGSCGRICPHPCQRGCTRGKKDRPVSIAGLKRAAVELADPADLGIEPGEPTGKDVGIVGAGPAGLSLAYQLALMGHGSVVYEALPVAGGMLSVGIPDFRLPRDVVRREIDFIKDLGVVIKTGEKVRSLEDLDHDAVFLGVGAHMPVRLNIKGTDLSGVEYGTPFLEGIGLGKEPAIGRKVAVIGGGNVAIDSARTALRLGAEEVTIYYRRSQKEMPAYQAEVDEAEADGVRFEYLTAPLRVLGEHGSVTGLELMRMELGECDESGRCRPVPVKGSEFTVPVDNVIAAIGQYPEVEWLPRQELHISKRKTVKVDRKTGRTSMEGVFAGGDCATGPATVARAIGAGRRAAISIDQYLRRLG